MVEGGKGKQWFAGRNLGNQTVCSIDLVFVNDCSQWLIAMLIDNVFSGNDQAISICIVGNSQGAALIVDNSRNSYHISKIIAENDQSWFSCISNNNGVVWTNSEIWNLEVRVIKIWAIYDVAEDQLIIGVEVIDRDIADSHLFVGYVCIRRQ